MSFYISVFFLLFGITNTFFCFGLLSVNYLRGFQNVWKMWIESQDYFVIKNVKVLGLALWCSELSAAASQMDADTSPHCTISCPTFCQYTWQSSVLGLSQLVANNSFYFDNLKKIRAYTKSSRGSQKGQCCGRAGKVTPASLPSCVGTGSAAPWEAEEDGSSAGVFLSIWRAVRKTGARVGGGEDRIFCLFHSPRFHKGWNQAEAGCWSCSWIFSHVLFLALAIFKIFRASGAPVWWLSG